MSAERKGEIIMRIGTDVPVPETEHLVEALIGEKAGGMSREGLREKMLEEVRIIESFLHMFAYRFTQGMGAGSLPNDKAISLAFVIDEFRILRNRVEALQADSELGTISIPNAYTRLLEVHSAVSVIIRDEITAFGTILMDQE